MASKGSPLNRESEDVQRKTGDAASQLESTLLRMDSSWFFNIVEWATLAGLQKFETKWHSNCWTHFSRFKSNASKRSRMLGSSSSRRLLTKPLSWISTLKTSCQSESKLRNQREKSSGRLLWGFQELLFSKEQLNWIYPTIYCWAVDSNCWSEIWIQTLLIQSTWNVIKKFKMSTFDRQCRFDTDER